MAAVLTWLAGPGANALLGLLPTIVAILRIWKITQPIITALEDAGLIKRNAISLLIHSIVAPALLTPEELQRVRDARMANAGEGGGA